VYKQKCTRPQAGGGTAQRRDCAGRLPRDKPERSRSGVRGYTRHHPRCVVPSLCRSQPGTEPDTTN
jgi:hypothetical protein